MSTAQHALRGKIVSAGFESGDRIVCGCWSEGPIGPMNDVMWVRPDGTRVLVAPTERAARFITAVYAFDDVVIEPVEVDLDGFALRTSRLRVELKPGRRIPIPLGGLRTPLVTRYVESPIARMLMGVRTYGVTSSGVHEWYRADAYRTVAQGHATLDGHSLGGLTQLTPPLQVGVSEPPKRPSMVDVRPLLWDPSGRLDEAFG